MNVSTDALVVGAGIIGASIAWRLAGRGLRVTLIDAGTLGGEASWAGAGMLAPGGELDRSVAWSDFALESLRLYANYVAQLTVTTGLSIDFRQCGAIEIAHSEREWANLSARSARQQALGIRVGPGPRPYSLFYPDDAIVDPRDTMRALRVACTRSGVHLLEGTPIRRIDICGGKVAIAERDATFAVLAAGAWSSSIPVFVDGTTYVIPRTWPVRGHLLGYKLRPGLVGPILRHEHTYILQRSNGFTIAGTSTEYAGFDRTINPAITADIRQRAEDLLPELRSAGEPEVWLGFRPGADEPVIRRVPGSTLWLAYGHYRNGILLAPATAERVTNEIISTAETDQRAPSAFGSE
jgi:glycine oxidase